MRERLQAEILSNGFTALLERLVCLEGTILLMNGFHHRSIFEAVAPLFGEDYYPALKKNIGDLELAERAGQGRAEPRFEGGPDRG